MPSGPAKAAPIELQDGGGQKVLIKSVRFSGATDLVPEAQLQALVADAIGKELDFLGLQSLAERVTAHLKGKGWFLARAYLPRQDITEGNLEIALIAGRLSQKQPVKVAPTGKITPRIDPARLQAIADYALPAGAPAQENAMNRAVLLMSDLPGLTARARLEPGDQDGETRILIGVEEDLPQSASLNLANHGSRDTGTAQLTGNFSFNSPLGRGDQISLSATASEGTTLARLAYSVPLGGALGADGWKLNLGYTDMRYRVMSASGRANGLEGQSQSTSIGLLYPWLRSRISNVYLNLSHARKELVDHSRTGTLRDKTVAVSALGLSGDTLDTLGGGGLSTASLSVTSGRLDLNWPDDRNADAGASGYGTAGHYRKLSYSATRLQKLSGSITLYASLNGQKAHKNLDSSEKLYLGGPSGVRAYPGSEGGGDSGAIANLEIRYDWPEVTALGNLQLQAFYDAGWTQLHHDPRNVPITTATQRNHYGITGAGIGISLTQPAGHVIRASYAAKLGSNPGRTAAGLDADSQAKSGRFWLQAMIRF